MKKLTLDQWEKKYIVEPVERFNPKNHMFSRPIWDPGVRGMVKEWRFTGEVGDKPGYSLRDLALRRAADAGRAVARLEGMTRRPPGMDHRPVAGGAVELGPAQELADRAFAPPPSMDGAMSGREGPLRVSKEMKEAYASDPAAATRDIKKVALYFGASAVGICRVDQRWVYSHTFGGGAPDGSSSDAPPVGGQSRPFELPEDLRYAVVMVYEEDYNMMKYYPSWIALSVTSKGYSDMAVTNMLLSAFVRNVGFKAMPAGNDTALSIPMAMQAGLGELGRNGLLITPRFGPRVRISKVFTDLPLVPDAPIEFGVTEFCEACEKCARLCSSQSILPGKGKRTTEPRTISNNPGVLKWPVDTEGCRAYWSRVNRSCTTCIACCPYNKADNLLHQTVRWATDHARWGDPLYAKLDDIVGYGKMKKPDRFWDDWQPTTGR